MTRIVDEQNIEQAIRFAAYSPENFSQLMFGLAQAFIQSFSLDRI